MTATLYYGFAKRENSTKRPSDTDLHADVDIVIKEPCNYSTPVFLIHRSNFYYQTSFNTFCTYINWNHKYYFVENFVFVSNDLIEVHCRIDVLAVYKTIIGASTQYVLRAASESDGTIIDNLYPAKRSILKAQNDPSETQIFTTLQDWYVVTYLSQNHGVKCYLAEGDQLEVTLRQMANVARALPESDPFSRLVSINYLPIRKEEIATIPYEDQIYFSDSLAVGFAGESIPSRIFSFNVDFTVTKHPQSSRGTYLNGAPYSKYMLYAGPFGTIELPGELLGNSIRCKFLFDFYTSKGTLYIYNGNVDVASEYITIANATLGVPIQVTRSTNGVNLPNILKIGGQLVGTAVSAASGSVTGIVSNAVGAIDTAIRMQVPRALSAGSNGSMNDILGLTNEFFALQSEFYYVADEYNVDYGRPLCKPKQLSTLSGYILCQNVDISVSGPISDTQKVKEYLEAGFFYE